MEDTEQGNGDDSNAGGNNAHARDVALSTSLLDKYLCMKELRELMIQMTTV
jgi:hypothetical protein